MQETVMKLAIDSPAHMTRIQKSSACSKGGCLLMVIFKSSQLDSTFIMLTELMRMYVFFQITSVGEMFFQTATGLAFVLAHVA